MTKRGRPGRSFRNVFLITAVLLAVTVHTAACTHRHAAEKENTIKTPAPTEQTQVAEATASLKPSPVITGTPVPEETPAVDETPQSTPEEPITPSPTPFYGPAIEEDPSVLYLEEPDLLSPDDGRHRAIPLWHSKEYLPYGANSYMPTVIPYLAAGEEPKGSVIIFPGGGYEMLSVGREGTDAAEYISETLGFNAFVVKYRVAPSDYHAILSDALRAVRFVRFYADELHADKDRIAVLGFSAGGHLAMMTAEHFDYGKEGDAVDAESSRPDAVFLCYPVTSLISYTHKGSRSNFLGREDTEENRIRFSAEKGLRYDMPPVFIVHSEDDQIVPIESSIETVRAMEEAGLDVSCRWYPEGGHGYGISGVKWYGIDWPSLMEEWLKEHGF